MENPKISEETCGFLEMESGNFNIYRLSEGQKMAVNQAREQIKKEQFLTNEQADCDIDEWLNK